MSQRREPLPRGWLPHPVLSVLLALVWLLLQETLDPANLLAAVAMGLIVPKLINGFLGPVTRLGAPMTALRLTAIVLWDIVVSNLTVARIVLSPTSDPRPAWVEVPLELEHPGGITLLASIITMTPGTVSCVIDEEHHRILVHALDCEDAAEMAAQMKQRYEQPLKEIFR